MLKIWKQIWSYIEDPVKMGTPCLFKFKAIRYRRPPCREGADVPCIWYFKHSCEYKFLRSVSTVQFSVLFSCHVIEIKKSASQRVQSLVWRVVGLHQILVGNIARESLQHIPPFCRCSKLYFDFQYLSTQNRPSCAPVMHVGEVICDYMPPTFV